MFRNSNHRLVFFIWLGWSLLIVAYQFLLPARFTVRPPDFALEWTATETLPGSQKGKVYLNEPFLNRHVAWDSEFYLAIAVGGYEDQNIHRIGESFGATSGPGYWPFVIPSGAQARAGIPLTYAFFPLYPMMMRLFAIPLTIFGLNQIATATLAGVIVSLLGTLAAMFALYEFAKNEMDEASGLLMGIMCTMYMFDMWAGWYNHNPNGVYFSMNKKH